MSLEKEIQAKGLTAARVTPADIEAAINFEYYFTASDGVRGSEGAMPSVTALDFVTICVLVLKNGTKVVGVNEGPVSPENFNAGMGRSIARGKAVDQIWPMLGYELRTKLAGAV